MSGRMTRREAIKQLTLASAAIVGGSQLASAQAPTPIAVYKDPNCGCCAKWVDHMKASGFTASVTETSDMNGIKARYHVSEGLRSCHTTIAGGYVIEGHVPAADVKRLLTQKPKGIAGLAIPGMPASAPGMDGTPFASYDVLAFDQAGKTSVFAKHAKA